MTRDMLRKNLRGAFEVKPKKVHALEDKISLLLMMRLLPDRQ